MSEMIERVARAMFERWLDEPETVREQPQNGPYPKWEDMRIGQEKWLNQARAAIEAMREPTKAQLEAAEDMVVGYDDFANGDGNIYLGIPGYPQKASDVWSALIDAELKEKA